MPTLADSKLESLFCLFKGEWGTRKSTQALSFPLPQFWLSWDQKMQGLLLPARKWGVDLTQVNYEDYNNWTKVEEKLKGFRSNCSYKTIIVDTISAGGDYINIQTRIAKSGTTNAQGEEKGKRVGGIVVNSLEDYKGEAAALQDMMFYLKDIHKYHNLNVILIGHVIQKDQKAADGQVTHVSRSIVTGSKEAMFKIPAHCQEVYHFNLKGDFNTEKKYALLTHHTREDFARTCLPLEKEIVFEDKPLYEGWIKPAIIKLNGMESEKPFRF